MHLSFSEKKKIKKGPGSRSHVCAIAGESEDGKSGRCHITQTRPWMALQIFQSHHTIELVICRDTGGKEAANIAKVPESATGGWTSRYDVYL